MYAKLDTRRIEPSTRKSIVHLAVCYRLYFPGPRSHSTHLSAVDQIVVGLRAIRIGRTVIQSRYSVCIFSIVGAVGHSKGLMRLKYHT